MRARLGPGPVFVYEWLTTTRRWQLYGVRAGFVGLLLAGMVMAWRTDASVTAAGTYVSLQTLANYGRQLFLTTVAIELTLVLLVAPAATAGAVCLDKARGTLDHMLATDLSNAEIVLGKLLVRLVPVLSLIACVLPLSALTSLLGGIDPIALFGSFLTAIGCAVLGCSLALALSVWGRKPHEVLMMTYLIIILWIFGPDLLTTILYATGVPSLRLAAPLLGEWLGATNPYFLSWGPYRRPGSVSMGTYLVFLGGCLLLSGILVALGTSRIRAVAQKQAGRTQARKGRRWLAIEVPFLAWQELFPGPSLDGNPVLWREWFRSKPSKSMRVVWALYCALGIFWIVVAVQSSIFGFTNVDNIAILNVFQVGLGLLLLSVSAVTSLAEERMRGSLDVLLTTPLSTRSILLGKWFGSFRIVPLLLFAPVLTSFLLASDSGRWFKYVFFLALLLAYSALIVSLGLALATWQSRLGRAAAGCVAGYVAIAVVWPVLLMTLSQGVVHMDDRVFLPLVFGSPLCGTLFGTLGLSGSHPLTTGKPEDLWVGAGLWTAIYGALATFLFATTVTTFDRCLGRIPDMDQSPYPLGWQRRLPPFDLCFGDNVVAEPPPQSA